MVKVKVRRRKPAEPARTPTRRRRHEEPVELDLLPAIDVRRKSEFWEFYRDGMSPSAIECFLRCREEFRLSFVEGWSEEGYSYHRDFGNLWHSLTAARLEGKTIKIVPWLRGYRAKQGGELMLPADLLEREIVDAQTIAMWPLYAAYWTEDANHEWLKVERVFKKKVKLASGRETWVRGTLDGMFDCSMGRGYRVRELKTKSQINVNQTEDLLLLDNQTMVYTLLAMWATGKKPSGIDYDLVRRPQSRPYKRKAETLQQYAKRLRKEVEKETPHYFNRIRKDIPGDYLAEWEKRVLMPILQEVEFWASGALDHFPSGAGALVPRPWASGFIPMITRGDRSGLKQNFSYAYQTKE